MKNTSSTNESNASVQKLSNYEDVTDSLIQSKRGHSLLKSLKCTEEELKKDYDHIKSRSMGHKGRFYQRVFNKSHVTQESRSQSLPNSLDDKDKSNGNVTDSCDTQIKLLEENESPPQSPTQELWFKTWPERCEKNKNVEENITNATTEESLANKSINSLKSCGPNASDQINKCVNNTLTLNEALQNISLAYSPITRQLHLIEKSEIIESVNCVVEVESKVKFGHRRTEAGSFSSTVSSLSDPSPSGSLLDADERVPSPNPETTGAKSKKKGFSSFFSRNVFSWRSAPTTPNANSGWKLFNTEEVEDTTLPASPKHDNIVASSTALILHNRPSYLPAKDSEEEQRHRDEYYAMVAAAKRKEAKNSAAKQRQQRIQLQMEEQLATATKYWNTQVLAKWDSMHKTKKTREIWWQGLPSSVRGKVWRLAIGNDLNVTQQLYEICLQRAQARLNSSEPSSTVESDVDQESSMDLIKLDIARTFPHLCIFQEGGPYSNILHSLLAAYVCYRPDVGYVQGMSFIAAILILNMEQFEAFICFANLLNRPVHLAAFTLNQRQMLAYYSAYNEVFNYNLPKLYIHFEKSGLTPDLYLLDWVYTIFSKAMPLDVACRVWDVFLRDGDEFIFRTALGVLHLHQEILLKMDFLHGAQFLTRLPDDLSADSLFRSIQTVYVCIGKQTFSQIVERCKESS